jgi:hypothetical protein
MRARQVRITLQIEAWRAPLDTGNGNLFDGIKADRPETEGLTDGGSDQVLFEHFQQTQHLDELPFALIARPLLHQPAQMIELIGQGPPLQRRCLIQCARLLLQKRQKSERLS